ncbi:acidic mammalian chitinase-like [Canna indica]|uniref:Acidic mammalian chitinase-like n=1 Tax=Canna indica TaxID=4628 RepID=A0AAQ3KYF1_9LILI|nr:acidic mammalian chitinase-like [Canna indica]
MYFAPRFFLSHTPQLHSAKQMAVVLDWINVMCYDFHGSWDTTATGEHPAMYDPRSNISTSYKLESWIASSEGGDGHAALRPDVEAQRPEASQHGGRGRRKECSFTRRWWSSTGTTTRRWAADLCYFSALSL